MSEIKLEKLDENRWLLPQTGGMRVPGIIYANEKIYQLLRGDESAKQVANVAHLPGIVNYSLAMPMSTGAMAFPSAVWRPFIWMAASFLRAESVMISTAAVACLSRILLSGVFYRRSAI